MAARIDRKIRGVSKKRMPVTPRIETINVRIMKDNTVI